MTENKNTEQEVLIDTNEKKIDHTNPFNEGVTYDSFLKAIGKKTIEEALKGKCTKEEINWIEAEVEHFKKQ